MNEYNFLLNFI